MVEVRAAVSDQDAIAIHRMLMQNGHEIAIAPVNPVKVMQEVYGLIKADAGAATLMAMDGDELVGVLGLVQVPFWYSDDHLIMDRIFYVLPANRGTAGRRLVSAARSIADGAKQILMIAQTNPTRRPKVLVFHPRS
ncbi:MAG TPA: hypothetical protein VNZ94_00605 [Xanthobacteraceae bacterium]|nr:hypothetical protein [Xanthobacteraceae bacterium]